MTLNCVIIDDEPLAAELLESYAQKVPFLRVEGVYNSATQAIKTIREKKDRPDIPRHPDAGTQRTGICKDNQQGNENRLPFERCLKTDNKALEWFDIQDRQKTMREDRFVFVKSEYKLQKINFDDILYVEGVKDYVKFYFTDSSKNIMSLMNMKKVEEYLPSPEFMRIHRSYIVHMPKVELVDRFRIVIGD